MNVQDFKFHDLIKDRVDFLEKERPEAIQEGVRSGFILCHGEKIALVTSVLLPYKEILIANVELGIRLGFADWLIILGEG